MTEPTTPPDESAEAFGAALATIAATEAYVDGLTPAELNEIGRRAGEAIRDAAREHWQNGMSEENARAHGSRRQLGPSSTSYAPREGVEG